MSCNYNNSRGIVIIGLGFDRAMRAAATAAMIAAQHALTGNTADILICDDFRNTSTPIELIVRPVTNFTVSTLDAGPWDLFEPFTNVPSTYKSRCYAPTPKQAKAKKSFTCTGRIRGNYY